MSKPALTLEPNYRSNLEKRVAEQLQQAGVDHTYESMKVEYVVPQRTAKYLPDFPITNTNILIEAKGYFGGGKQFGGRASDGADQRQKMVLLKEQHPEWDIRIVFERASTKIYPKSPTTYGKWATDHGFTWSDKGVIPQSWLDEIKQLQTD